MSVLTLEVGPNVTFTALGYSIYDAAGSIIGSRVTAGIVDVAAAGRTFIADVELTGAAVLVVWDDPTGADPDFWASENLESYGVGVSALVEDYPVDGQSATTVAQMLYAINQMLSEFARTGTTVSIKKRDGTEAFQLTLDSATAPTSSTQAT